jgi:hypothetical protein
MAGRMLRALSWPVSLAGGGANRAGLAPSSCHGRHQITAVPGGRLPAPRLRFDAAFSSRARAQAYQGVCATGPSTARGSRSARERCSSFGAGGPRDLQQHIAAIAHERSPRRRR